MNRVKEYRLRLGLSQEELAKRAGIPRTTLSAIESGRVSPSVEYALRLARVLKASVEELFGKEEEVRTLKEGFFYNYKAYDKWVYVGASPFEGEMPDGYMKDNKAHFIRKESLPTLAIAGCDPSLKLLSAPARERGIRLLYIKYNSLKALELLERGLIHIAGMHLGSLEENLRFVKDRLGEGYRILRLFTWEEGIALRERKSLKELRGLNWLVREEGSGARKVFEELRGELSIEKCREIEGGHEEVAMLIRNRFGDAGICPKGVAYSFGLDYVSLKREDYCLVYREELEEEDHFKDFLRLLLDKTYREFLSELPGYQYCLTEAIKT